MAEITASQAASILSRLGASKGGKARAWKLTPERMSEIAATAARARWGKRKKKPNTK